MNAPRHTSRGFLLGCLLLIVAFGCSSSTDSAPPPGSTSAVLNTTTLPGGPAAAGACSLESLTAAAQVKYPGGVLVDLVCDGPFGAATVTGGGAFAEDLALFRMFGETWATVANGAVDAEVAKLVPGDFSVGTFQAWQAKRRARVTPPTTAKPGPPRVNTTVAAPVIAPPATVCKTQVDDMGQCIGQPTIPPSPGVTSQFCRFNFNDPRCVSDPNFPG